MADTATPRSRSTVRATAQRQTASSQLLDAGDGRLLCSVRDQPPVGVDAIAERPVATEMQTALALVLLDVADALEQRLTAQDKARARTDR